MIVWDFLPSTNLVRRHLIKKVWQVCHLGPLMVYDGRVLTI